MLVEEHSEKNSWSHHCTGLSTRIEYSSWDKMEFKTLLRITTL